MWPCEQHRCYIISRAPGMFRSLANQRPNLAKSARSLPPFISQSGSGTSDLMSPRLLVRVPLSMPSAGARPSEI